MKTLPILLHRRRGATAGAALLAATLVTGLTQPTHAVDAPAAAPKDYTLFVGVDLAVQQGGTYRHVIGATDRALVIENGGQHQEIALRDAGNLRIAKGVKLGTVSATIANVKAESVDREAAQAQLNAFRSYLAMSTQAGDLYDRMQGQLILAGMDNWPVSDWDPDKATKTTNIVPAQAAFDATIPGTGRNLDIANSMFGDNLTKPGAPTVEISFDVSAPQPLEQAYLVVVAEFASNTKANEVARQVSARALGRVDATPRRVTMAHTASAPGFTFKRFHIALFADGQEVVTNLAENRLALTEDQAYQFVVANYLIAQKGQTRPPAPVLMTSRTDLRRRADPAQLNTAIYARVDKSGGLVALSADEGGAVKVAATTQAALQKVRFAPALDKGVPVDGRVKFTLASLVN